MWFFERFFFYASFPSNSKVGFEFNLADVFASPASNLSDPLAISKFECLLCGICVGWLLALVSMSTRAILLFESMDDAILFVPVDGDFFD